VNAIDSEVAGTGSLPTPFVDPLGSLRRRWRWVLAILVLGLGASAGVYHELPERYYAEATVVVSRQQISESLVEPTVEEDSLARIDALAAEVLSRANVGALVEELGLYAELRGSETLGEIVDRVRREVSLSTSQLIDRRSRNTSALVYGIGFEADDPENAASVANRVADLFVEASLERQHRQHQLTSAFLRDELVEAEQVLREQNRVIAAFKQQYRGLLPSDLQANLTRLDLLQSQRQSLAIQINEAEARVVVLASEPPPDSPDADLRALRDELRRMDSNYTSRHPDRIALAKQIESLELELAARGDRELDHTPTALREAAERTVAVLQAQLEATELELVQLDERIDHMPQVQEDLAALEEKAMILRENYLEFLRKVQDAELAEDLLLAQQGERISVLNRAEPPSKPTRARWQALVIAIGVSIAAALGAALLVELVDPVVVSADQVEQITSLPVLGSVGRIG
jgi:uncharacterized protein involved in exopolysaccharide biosynthesis